MKNVRRAEERDIPALMNLLVQVDMVHHQGRPDLFKGPATKYTAEELREILRKEETPVFVCVEEDGGVIGHGFCVMETYGGTLMTERKTLYIDDICVDEKHRGSGAGRMLYEHIRAYAKKEGCYNLTLNVWCCNPGAMRFYEEMGMTPYKIGMETIISSSTEGSPASGAI